MVVEHLLHLHKPHQRGHPQHHPLEGPDSKPFIIHHKPSEKKHNYLKELFETKLFERKIKDAKVQIVEEEKEEVCKKAEEDKEEKGKKSYLFWKGPEALPRCPEPAAQPGWASTSSRLLIGTLGTSRAASSSSCREASIHAVQVASPTSGHPLHGVSDPPPTPPSSPTCPVMPRPGQRRV
jgi:hypothetical protein